MIIPTSPDAMKKLLQRIVERLDTLERGGGTRGQASFSQRIRIGDVYIEAVDTGSGIELRAQNVDGSPPVTLATL